MNVSVAVVSCHMSGFGCQSVVVFSLVAGIDRGPGPVSVALGLETVAAVVAAAAAGDGSATGGAPETGNDQGDSEPCRFYRMSARKCCS